MLPKEEKFLTRDIGLATTLVTKGFQVINVTLQWEGGVRHTPVGYFQFEGTPELKKIEKLFWSGSCQVEPKMFLLNLRSLKSQVNGQAKTPFTS